MPHQDRSKTGHGHWSAVCHDDVGADVADEFGHRLLIADSPSMISGKSVCLVHGGRSDTGERTQYSWLLLRSSPVNYHSTIALYTYTSTCNQRYMPIMSGR
jgi:hypothetical protein